MALFACPETAEEIRDMNWKLLKQFQKHINAQTRLFDN